MISLRALKKKQIAIFAIGVLLLAGAAVYYEVQNKPSPSSDRSAVTENFETQEQVPELTAEQKTELEKEYEEQEKALEFIDQLNHEQQRDYYLNLAFSGSRLYDEDAKEYAAKALSYYTKEQLEEPDMQGLINGLRYIEKGEFDKYNKSVLYEGEKLED